jgi:hypothetical protein
MSPMLAWRLQGRRWLYNICEIHCMFPALNYHDNWQLLIYLMFNSDTVQKASISKLFRFFKIHLSSYQRSLVDRPIHVWHRLHFVNFFLIFFVSIYSWILYLDLVLNCGYLWWKWHGSAS